MLSPGCTCSKSFYSMTSACKPFLCTKSLVLFLSPFCMSPWRPLVKCWKILKFDPVVWASVSPDRKPVAFLFSFSGLPPPGAIYRLSPPYPFTHKWKRQKRMRKRKELRESPVFFFLFFSIFANPKIPESTLIIRETLKTVRLFSFFSSLLVPFFLLFLHFCLCFLLSSLHFVSCQLKKQAWESPSPNVSFSSSFLQTQNGLRLKSVPPPAFIFLPSFLHIFSVLLLWRREGRPVSSSTPPPPRPQGSSRKKCS